MHITVKLRVMQYFAPPRETPLLISDEAAEAAAKVYYRGVGWDDLDDRFKRRTLDYARAVLEAAAPYLKADAGDEGRMRYLHTTQGIAMQISDEAVEALANIIEATERKGLPSEEPSWAHYIARSALEAAAPHIAADAFVRGLAVGYYVERGWTYAEALQQPLPEHLTSPDEYTEEIPNPYTSPRG